MRIVVLNERKPERDALLRALASAKYQAEGVGDEAAALAAITREPPQIIVFSVPSRGSPDLVRRLKGADASGQTYLLAVFENTASSKDLSSTVEAGAHDFLRRPVVDTEFLERIKAPGRLVRWAKSLATPAAFDLAAPVNISGMQAWSALGDLVAGDLSEMAGCPLSVSRGWPKSFVHQLRGATIPMSLAGEQLEVRVSVVADATGLRWIKANLLGDPNATADAADDALRELANTAGGALKRAALAENIALTTGIPGTDNPAPPPEQHACWTLALDADGSCLAVVGEIRQRTNQRVPASQLSEGMIIAHDVRNEGGILLVPAGARLTGTTAAKLSKMLGPRFFLEVAPAD